MKYADPSQLLMRFIHIKNWLKLVLPLLLFIASDGLLQAQDPVATGYISLPDSTVWYCVIDDSIPSTDNYPNLAVQTGWHHLKVLPKNSRNWLDRGYWFDIHVQPADTLFIASKLIHIQPMDSPFEFRKYSVQQTEFNSPGLFSRKNLKPALIITAIAANWASFALKREADDYYDKYKKTSDLTQMDHYYLKTKVFDNAASAALAVSISALTAYFYFLLTD